MKRTEEEILTQAGINVILGGEDYSIRPLVIRDAREWRAKVIKLIAPIPDVINVKSDAPEDFGQALTTMLVTMPDQVIDLFFEYAKDLNREDIEGKATEHELQVAFREVYSFAFPLAKSLPDVLMRILQPTKSSQSEASSSG